MSDNIDYDELDKAVSEAIQTSNKKSTPAKTSTPKPAVVKNTTHSGTVAVNVVKNTTVKPSPRRPQYMDIARPARSAAPRVARPAVASRPASAPAPAAQPRIVTSAPSSHTVRPMRSAAANTLSPQMAAQIRKQQLLQKKRQQVEQQRREAIIRQQQLARQKMIAKKAAAEQTAAKQASAESAKLAQSAAAAKNAIEARQNAEREAPNANNYSLGVRSPFVVKTNVEKRPLGTNIPDTSLKELKSTKNVYSQKSPSKKKQIKKHTVVEAPKKTSGWAWTLIVLFVIAAGGALGYLAYLIVFNNGF